MSKSRQIIPLVQGLKLVVIKQEAEAIHLVMEMTSPTATCPFCGEVSNKARSHYERTVSDVAWCGIPVVIRFTARRFACVNADCPQQIFCERVPELVPAYGRRTSGNVEHTPKQLHHAGCNIGF